MEQKYLLIIEYSFVRKILVLFFRLIAFGLGISFILIDNVYVQIFGFFSILYGVIGFFRNIFFKKMIFYDEYIETRWNVLGWRVVKNIMYSKVSVMKINGILGGSISFLEKKNNWQTMFFFTIDLLPLSKDQIENIKNILIKNNVIKGDEYVWSN